MALVVNWSQSSQFGANQGHLGQLEANLGPIRAKMANWDQFHVIWANFVTLDLFGQPGPFLLHSNQFTGVYQGDLAKTTPH